MWSGERLTKIQATTRPDHVWPEVWTNIGKVAQNREKQGWEKEKPKLDNTWGLRGIYFIDHDDQDNKETLENARRKVERPMVLAMPCELKGANNITKVFAHSEIACEKTPKTICGCILESHESTRQRLESSQPKNHEDHIASKRFLSMTH